MKTLYRFGSYGLLLGVVHTALTPAFYSGVTLEALWFAGTGLALVFLSLLNIVAERTRDPLALSLSAWADASALIYSALVVLVLREPQAYVALAVVSAATLGAAATWLQTAQRSSNQDPP